MLRPPLYTLQVRSYATSPKGHTHFFAGAPLNRLAWLRTSPAFLNAAALAPATRWLLFRDGAPLLSAGSLARLPPPIVRPLLGPAPFFGQAQHPSERADADAKPLEAARLHGPPAVFLGLHESGERRALPSSEFAKDADVEAVVARIEGTPYFALDVSGCDEGVVREAVGEGMEFVEGRKAMGLLGQFDSGVFSLARTMVDWNARNKFCAGCGSPVYTLWAGWKHGCSSLLPWATPRETPCPTAKALNNYMHPRTDPVVIILTVSPDNSRILLGRNRTWPPNFYSALAGFVEPGESHEDTVERELWEEAGITLLGLKYHSTQPWPFPANVMAGYYAIADPDAPVRTDLDNELEDARWYTRAEVLAALGESGGHELPKWDSAVEETGGEKEGEKEVKKEVLFKGPPPNAMAGVLIADWAHGRVELGVRQDGDLV